VTSVQLGTGGTGWLRRRRLVQPGPDSEGEQALLRRLGDLGHRHDHLLRDGAFARIAGRAHCPTSQRAHTCCTLRMLPTASMGRGNVKLGLVFTHTLAFAPLREVPALLAWLGVVLGAYLFLAVVVFALPLVILVWFFLQLHRAHLLGGGVRVSEDTLPGLQLALVEVRQRLGYYRPIDVYVVEKADPAAFMVSYLGTRIIVFEGALVADLQSLENRPKLVFLIGQFLGALKARHQRFGPIIIVFNSVRSLRLLNFLLNPYTRATTYSGDQIGMACCGDIQAA